MNPNIPLITALRIERASCQKRIDTTWRDGIRQHGKMALASSFVGITLALGTFAANVKENPKTSILFVSGFAVTGFACLNALVQNRCRRGLRAATQRVDDLDQKLRQLQLQ